VLALLHSHYPLRNDFGDVQVVSAAQHAKLTKQPESLAEQNYLVVSANSSGLKQSTLPRQTPKPSNLLYSNIRYGYYSTGSTAVIG
jgi:hypothetical protein